MKDDFLETMKLLDKGEGIVRMLHKQFDGNYADMYVEVEARIAECGYGNDEELFILKRAEMIITDHIIEMWMNDNGYTKGTEYHYYTIWHKKNDV